MKPRLRESLEALLLKEEVSAHMPGHKYRSLHQTNWFKLDTTEIDGTDNLHMPSGILKDAMAYCAGVFGAQRSHYLINGSTVGLLAAIIGSTKNGDKIIMGRDCHKAVYSALSLHQLSEIVIMPKVSCCGEMLGYDPQDIIAALMENLQVKVVVLTSPTYFGYCTPVSEIVRVLNERNGLLIIDEAHGAHLSFRQDKEWCALNQGAHIVIQSAHKMLPALTQTGLIHFNHGLCLEVEKQVLSILSMLQSTSPSYLLMCSIDDAIHWMVEFGLVNHQRLEARIEQLKKRELKEWINPESKPHDLLKLWLSTEQKGLSGYEVNEWLIEHGIMPEMANPSGVLLYLSAMTTDAELTLITEALSKLPSRVLGKELICPRAMPMPNRVISMGDMMCLAVEKHLALVPIQDAVGLVCATKIVPYPPGVPLLMPGERVTHEHIDYLMSLSKKHVVLGFPSGEQNLLCVDNAYFE